ncbi:putative ionotropic glutamate receptor, metazoa [Rosa chinensis]|uniref:Putative ionotropic glutamate receptor, metazoa n=1 Tax=Rosa chinensis TaxID=74649 RepID=A0A2P6QGE6_ROSCH|nr:putative ionotropic glutamate receptor, metazoa [Rosa chinensis]
MVEQVHNKTFDAGVGDFTVLADRLDKVEFTQPYIESGLSMIVQEKNEQLTWMFIKPLTWEMWAASGGVLVYTMLIIWFLERPSNPEFSGPLKNQIGTATWFAFTSLFFSHREKIHNNLTRVVVVMWLFVVLILTSSYTANLSSMLTIQRLKPNVTDIEMLKRTNSKVGLDGDSFVVTYMERVLQFNSQNIITISNEFNYTEAFKNGSISAAFLELPYAKVFMNHYCKGYTATTPTFRFGGLGFVSCISKRENIPSLNVLGKTETNNKIITLQIFQKCSPIARDFTKAILELLEDGELKSLEDTWLTPNRDCPNNASSDVPDSLSVKNFMGLYVISSATSTICLLLSFTILLKKFQQHEDAYLGNASDESVWNRTVRKARFLYNKEFNVPSRAPSIVDVPELTSSQGEHVITSTPQEHQLQASTPAQTESGPLH